MARDEGWMAEHMLILKLTSPEGVTKYVTGAFPSACGKTNLAMLIPTLPDWKVETVGDDIAWMKFGHDGRLYAINPESGFFGVAPNTSEKTNPNAVATIRENSIFTNCAKTDDGDIWWEGMTEETPSAPDRLARQRLDARLRQAGRASECALHDAGRHSARRSPPSGRTRPACRSTRCCSAVAARPSCRSCTRRSTGSTDVFIGSIMSSETTAAAAGAVGELRYDPFAMLPFCGYHMGDYFEHWIEIGERGDADKLPKIFNVNWFRKDADGRFLWPGFGENSRVLEWVFRRCEGTAEAVETPIGLVPAPGAINTDGLDISDADLAELLKVDVEKWKAELPGKKEHLDRFGDQLPQELRDQLARLERELS